MRAAHTTHLVVKPPRKQDVSILCIDPRRVPFLSVISGFFFSRILSILPGGRETINTCCYADMKGAVSPERVDPVILSPPP